MLPQSDSASTTPHHSPHRFDQLRGIVANPIFEYRLHLLDIIDLLRWIALDNHKVCLFAGSDGADPIEIAKNCAPLYVAMWIASSGVNPASTSNSTSR